MNQNGNASVMGLLAVLFWLAMGIGWVLNLIALFRMAQGDGPITGMMMLRGVGVFLAPIGSVLGWFF